MKIIRSGLFRIRVRIVDGRTGQKIELDRIVRAASAREAAGLRTELIGSFETSPPSSRIRVGDFARMWIRSKAGILDRDTVDGYVSALDRHVLPALGCRYYDSLRAADVQAWVNTCLDELWSCHQAKSVAARQKRRRYTTTSIHSWFRVFRNMTQDAVAQLDLRRDPTDRVMFPDRVESEGTNALSADQLARFLDAMKARYPRDYALAAVLAFTGLRFCHASALRWEDIDEAKEVIRIQRKQKSGEVGPLSRRKRAPRYLPLVPRLATILREHRHRLMAEQALGFADGWVFPSEVGTLKNSGSLVKAWRACAAAAGVEGRFTVHGLRRTFNDLARRSGIDAVVTRSITGHVTEQMQEHYSSVDLEEKRIAIMRIVNAVPRTDEPY